MLNENVKKLLAERMWDLATCADNEPNVVSVAFKDVTERRETGHRGCIPRNHAE